jgi:hypothetical protein
VEGKRLWSWGPSEVTRLRPRRVHFNAPFSLASATRPSPKAANQAYPIQHLQLTLDRSSLPNATMPPRKSNGKQRAVQDSSDDEGPLPKYGDIEPQYLNQPVDAKQSDTKLRGLIGDLNNLLKDLAMSADMIADAAGDVAESTEKDEEKEMGPDEIPEDSVRAERGRGGVGRES